MRKRQTYKREKPRMAVSETTAITPSRTAMLVAGIFCAFAMHAGAQDEIVGPQPDPVLEYLNAIEDAESVHGAYAPELVDLYHGMGSLLLEKGELETARDAFHRTVLVSRVNSGPNSLDQSNYLYSIAEIESRLGNPQAALRVLENVYSLHAMHFGEGNPEMLPVVTKMHDWYLEKRPLQAQSVRSADYENLSFLASHIAWLTEASNGLGDEETALRYRALGQLHFRALYHLLQTGEMVNSDLVFSSAQHGDLFAERAPRRHFSEGEAAFRRAAAAWLEMPESTNIEQAEAIAQVGDWYLAIKNFNEAHDHYARAYQLLAGDSEPHVRDYFQQPTPLRFLATEEAFVRSPDLPQGPTLEISMSVTRNGLLSHIEFLNVPAEESPEQLDYIRRRLENTRFRPAIIEGKPAELDGFVWNLPISMSPVDEPDSIPEPE